MASLPSGSREDVELVKIETDDLSLVIKGKPYHERYEGLKQYRVMGHHDVMFFDANGETIREKKVYDIAQQQMVKPGEQRPIFFENGVYQLIVVPKNDIELRFYHEYPLIRKAVKTATELPELFMKSKEEMTIWRMLRRVSDQIKVDLDDAILDQASRIKKYRIKDIIIQLNRVDQEIAFYKSGEQHKFSIELLDQNPSAIFKKLIEIMNLE